jgi:MSHA biogenesis protein MshI
VIPFFGKKLLPGLSGVGVYPQGACVVRIERDGGHMPNVTAFDFRPWEDGGDQSKLLSKLAAAHKLDRARCTTLLDVTDYSLLLTEAPDVPADELRSAIRWRVKDLIDFHINDATLDVFDLPGEKVTGRARPMYAVAARSAAIQRRVDLLTSAGINLDVIDIPELAQRNLAALLPEDTEGVVLLSFGNDGGLITISRQGELYLSRNMEIGLDKLALADDLPAYFDRIVLEVQRSLDYYDSHFRQAPINHVVLAPLAQDVPGLVDYLKANLNGSVSIMDLSRMLNMPQEMPASLQSIYLTTLGAALRIEEKAL